MKQIPKTTFANAFVACMKERCVIAPLSAEFDYRGLALGSKKLVPCYFTPLDDKASANIDALFAHLTADAPSPPAPAQLNLWVCAVLPSHPPKSHPHTYTADTPATVAFPSSSTPPLFPPHLPSYTLSLQCVPASIQTVLEPRLATRYSLIIAIFVCCICSHSAVFNASA